VGNIQGKASCRFDCRFDCDVWLSCPPDQIEDERRNLRANSSNSGNEKTYFYFSDYLIDSYFLVQNYHCYVNIYATLKIFWPPF